MPFPSLPSFSDGAVLTASSLNTLVEATEFLYALVSGAQQGFSSQTLTGSGTSREYHFRRQGRYLHYKCRLTTGTSDELDIRIDGYAEATDATNRSSPYSWTGYVDLQATTSAPAVGDWYTVVAEFDFASGGDFIIDYFIESSETTL